MRVYLTIAACALLASDGVMRPLKIASPLLESSNPTPLILAKDEGERRVWRPIEGDTGWNAQPGVFILKIDPKNGGSSHMVFGTEPLPPGATIDRHKHPGSDEIIYFENGTARVSLAGTVRDVHGGATVFIPANTWISVTNTGTEPIHIVFIFSAPGFDAFMRAESVPKASPITPLSKAQDAAIMKSYEQAVVYQTH
jgi:quercetin dioxygenase-like cupin family protein